ncbi:MAG: stage sporulation protein [Actinomycetota bacterium]|jgi:SpoIID/LytB domain protein|nr:stage sporulation protein [Actinomycetota bacterium]
MHRRISAPIVILLLGGLLAPSAARAARTVTITGGGWGHGIGMSQYGTYGRALKGQTAEAILQHYYSGVEVGPKKMPKVRVGLLQERNQVALTSGPYLGGSGDVDWMIAGQKEPLASGAAGADWRVEPSATGGMRLYKGGEQIRRDGTGVFGGTSKPLYVVFERHASLIDVDDKSYNYAFGRLEVGTYPTDRCDSGYCLRLVLSITMQKYLYGLGEVPSSWPAGALRTQAIAGRTYAYEKWTRSGSHRYPCDCTVYDSTLDQAYAGDGKRTGSGSYWDDWQAAVNTSKDEVVTYNGAPIQALYSSSSGGYTENNENVWGGTPLPYLRGVPDKPDSVSANPNYKWDPVTMSFADFEGKLQAAYGMGTLKEFELVKPFGVSGRVTVVNDNGSGGVKIVGSSKTVRVSGWSFRTAFGSTILKDTLFRIDIAYEVGDNFKVAYRNLDRGPGDPTSAPYQVPKGANTSLGQTQDFTVGRMTWRKETDEVVWQWGEVLKRYSRLGREASKLGMPTSGIWGEAGKYQGGSYANGIILWSEATGAHHVRGAFFDSFQASGGRKRMGLPTADLTDSKDGGHRQRFTRGTLYQSPKSSEVFALWGAIDEKYRALGGAKSKCGYPTASMVVDSAGSAAAFQHGSIVWTKQDGVKVHCN